MTSERRPYTTTEMKCDTTTENEMWHDHRKWPLNSTTRHDHQKRQTNTTHKQGKQIIPCDQG